MDTIIQAVQASTNAFTKHKDFVSFMERTKAAEGDLIVVNNSFLYRSKSYLKTVKNEKYLALKIAESLNSIDLVPLIVKPGHFTNPFKKYTKSNMDFPQIPLKEAIQTELEELGKLIFILLSQVEERLVVSKELFPNQTGNEKLEKIVLDRDRSKPIEIVDSTIYIQEIYDEESIWQEIVKCFGKLSDVPPRVRSAVGKALDDLHKETMAKLKIPISNADLKVSITDNIISVLKAQKKEYEHALNQCGGFKDEKHLSDYHDLLRIAYNFSSDAITFINLIVSICDLKPLILWGTIDKRFNLFKTVQNIPWEYSFDDPKKPSLEKLRSIINDARNSDFHDLFPFRETLEVALPDNALIDASLRIFSLHGNKDENQIIYKDKELVDVLTQFTRARYRIASSAFWNQNLKIMDATIELFSQTANFLKIVLNEISQDNEEKIL